MNPIIQHISAWILFTLIIPFVVVIFLPLKIYKLLVIAYVKFFKPHLHENLTTWDEIFAIDRFHEKPFAGNGTVFIVDGNLKVEVLRDLVIKNIISVKNEKSEPQFRRLFQIPESFMGHYFWGDLRSVDLTEQIRVHHAFKSDNHEAELNDILGKMMTEPFPNALWEFRVFENYNKVQTVVVFRLHHVLGDGYTFNHLVDRLIGKESEYMVQKKTKSWDALFDLIFNGPVRLFKLYAEAFAHKDVFTTRKNSISGVLCSTTLNLEKMKSIRRYSKTHFATVGMSLLAGALRRYYKEVNRENELPEWVSIMHSLPKPGHPLKEMVNHWGVGLFKIPFDSSPLKRLIRAEGSFDQYMKDQYNELICSQVPLFSLLPVPLVKLFFSTNFGTGIGFTSVPGYGKSAELCGFRIRHMYKVFGLQWKESAVAAAVYTHNSELSFSIFANKDILPDQKTVDRVTKEYLHEEFAQLLKECGLKEDNNYTIVKRNSRAEGYA